MAAKVKSDFSEGKIDNFHPEYINNRKRKYHCTETEQIAREFWEKEATIPDPAYRKVM